MFGLIIADVNRILVRAARHDCNVARAGCRFVAGSAAGLNDVIAREVRKARIRKDDVCAAQGVIGEKNRGGCLEAEHDD